VVGTAVIVAASILLMLVRPRGIAEVWWVSGGAMLLVALGLVTPRSAVGAVAKGADVYFFLTGMMLLSALASAHGVFEWLSSIAVKGARGSCRRLFATVYGVGTVVTILMSNDATAVVLTPAILAAVRKAKAAPLPYLFACALIANAASFVLPISNPANLVVFHGRMPSLGQWLAAFALPSVLSIATTYVVLRWVFRRELGGAVKAGGDAPPLGPHGRLALGSLGLVSVVLLAASALDLDLGLPTLVAALVVVVVVSLAARKSPAPLAAEVSWSTLVLVAGLFVLVQAVENVGALDATRRGLEWVSALPRSAGVLVASFVVGVANNLVNNLPLGLLAGATLRSSPVSPSLTHATLIGVDLGPNLAVTGSLATLLWLLALRKEKLDVSFWAFLKVGALAMPAALFAATLGSLASDGLSGHAGSGSPLPTSEGHP
jgi:arsenical pump membrane protein